MRAICKFVDGMTNIGAMFAATALGLTVMCFWVEVVSRYFLNSPTNITSSLAKHVVMVSVMAMLPWLSREGYHVAMSFVYERAPKKLSQPIGIVITTLSAVICLMSAWMSYIETHRLYVGSITNDDVITFPLWWSASFMVYGFAGAAFQFARQAITGAIVQRGEV